MSSARRIYDLLAAVLKGPGQDFCLTDVMLGLNWSSAGIARTSTASELLATGMCFSPTGVSRQIPWAGSLRGRSCAELLPWLEHWSGPELVCAIATINAISSIDNPLLQESKVLLPDGDVPANLTPFTYFAPQLAGKNIVVVGHYPNMERFQDQFQYHCLERQPYPGDFPAEAAAFLLPEADWVFVTASSLANKTLPDLLALATQAQVVLMGPSLPWLAEWAEFGVDYLAGIRVNDAQLLRTIVAEGGGTRIFDQAVNYCVAAL